MGAHPTLIQSVQRALRIIEVIAEHDGRARAKEIARAADLSTCLFVTQSQVSAARGDAGTAIPAAVGRPAHWGPTGQVTGPGR